MLKYTCVRGHHCSSRVFSAFTLSYDSHRPRHPFPATGQSWNSLSRSSLSLWPLHSESLTGDSTQRLVLYMCGSSRLACFMVHSGCSVSFPSFLRPGIRCICKRRIVGLLPPFGCLFCSRGRACFQSLGLYIPGRGCRIVWGF